VAGKDLHAAFIEFADTFVDDYDVVEFLHRLAERCVDLVGAAEAGIMLADSNGNLQYVASSSERMRLIDLFQLQHNEGPCVDAFRSGSPVHSSTTADLDTRWPNFAPHALELGFHSATGLPMRLRTDVIGALNLFSTTPEPLKPEDQEVAQALADIATIGILQERALNDGRILSTQLEGALQSRVVIEQAKGFIAEHNHVTVDAAFALLRGYSRSHHRLLRQVAEDIITGNLDASILTVPTPRLPA